MAGDLQRLTGSHGSVGPVAWPHRIPQHPICVVQQHRRVDGVAQRNGSVDVIVVTVGQHDGLHPPAVDRRDDRVGIVRGVEDDHFAVVADQPDVVGDCPLPTIEGEDAVGGDQFDRANRLGNDGCETALSWKAIDVSEMVSLTNVERQPALLSNDQHRKSRDGRQSLHHDDFSAPPGQT